MSLETAYNTIEKLVEDFKANEKHYLAPTYSESQARIDFIDKFLIALGWDVNHDIQKNPYEQEVKVERGVDIGDARKRADYSFSLAPNYRDTVFFVEAKKPSKNLYNPNDYFQAIRYGWNAENPIVVLTDFEEFHIIDSRSKPNIKNIKFSLDKKIKSYHWSEYSNKEKFQEIYYLFSREAVAENSISKFTETLPKPKGKAFQKGLFAGAYKSLDDAFLEELDEIRNSLAKAFKKSNPSLDSESLTEATQRVIDRLVFIRFLEDKLIEGETHIDKYGEKSISSWQDFINDSKLLNNKYNGVVFKEHFIEKAEFNAPDDTVFRGICEDICIQNSPYLFNYFPIHILGSIYERFLGKVVVATAKQVKIEEKPEVRKAGGVYYTPQYIVQYIVENTVGKLIDGKTPKEITKLSFADISCGSGSFLITVYDTVLHYIAKWYQQNSVEAEKAGCILKEGQWILSLEQKKNILKQNIFGVDIDTQAVEVTQLSLFLKLLEDETLASIQQGELFFKSKILPDLSKNIVCGNSLIGTDIRDGNMFPDDEERKINAMNFEDAFPEIMKNGGFDAIVGNPPWIDIKGLDPIHVGYYFKKYLSTENRINIYSIFIEKSITLLVKKGLLGYIIPSSILYQSSYSKLRKLILQDYNVNTIVRMPDDTFKNVKAESNILIINKSNSKECLCIIYDRSAKIGSISIETAKENKKISTDNWLNNSFYTFDIFTNQSITDLLIKIENKKVSLFEICEFTLGITPYDKYKGHTPKQIEDRVFHSDKPKDMTYKKLLAGGDVTRYSVNWGGKEYLKYGKWLGAPREHKFFTIERILVRQIVSGNPLRIYAAYTKEEIYNVQSIFNIIVRQGLNYDIKFILAILNSTLMNFFHANKFLDLSKNLFQKILIQNCKNFPYPSVNFEQHSEKKQHDILVELVDQMLDAKKRLTNTTTDKDKTFYENKCNSLDRQIDRLVYELYGLTEDEIRIVEG